MSANIENVNNPNLKDTTLYFKISELNSNNISKLWPVFLVPNVRKWVKDHIYDGYAKDAYVNVYLSGNDIRKIESEILFST